MALAYAPAGPLGVNGIWAAIPIGWFLADAVGYGYYFPPAQSAAPWGERRLIRGIKKSGASPMNCTPFVGQYGVLSNKWGVFICQREYHRIKFKLNGLSPVQYRIQTVQAAYSCFCLTFGVASMRVRLFYYFTSSGLLTTRL